MDTRADSRTRILVQVDLGQKASRDFLGGVLRYAALHPAWDVRISRGHPKNRLPGSSAHWRPNGLICDRRADRATVARLAKNGLRGLVALHDDAAHDPRVRGVALLHAVCDNARIGEAGARFLLAKGLRHFAYVPATVDSPSLDRRRAAFADTLAAAGFAAAVYRPPRRRRAGTDALAAWLADLPKPCGVMAAFDQRAKNVMDACRLAQIDIPAQMLVLGVDNEKYICENTLPSLSSILPDFNGGGFRAAEALQAMIDAPAAPRTAAAAPLLYGVRRIVERASTADVSGTARSVALACEFIRRNAAARVGIDDIVAASGTSKRLLEKHFRAVLGTTAAHELQRTRLELVKKRLVETDLPLARIGETCGFNDESHLKKLFHRATGLTMGDYRRRSAAASAAATFGSSIPPSDAPRARRRRISVDDSRVRG